MRLFVLSPFAPRLDATNGTSKTIAQFLSGMGKHHKICLVYLSGRNEPPIDDKISACCDCAVEIIRPWSGSSIIQKWARRGRLVASLIGRRPMWVTDWYSREYAEKVQSTIKKWQPDIVQIESHVMGQYLPAIKGCKVPRVLNIHEPGERAAPFIVNTSHISRMLNYYDRLAWRHYEQAIVNNVDEIVVFTDQDRAAIAKYNPTGHIAKIPIGTEIPEIPLNSIDSYPPRLMFFGSFIHPPNLDAAFRLAQSIFPSLHAQFPDLELYIVGDQPPQSLKNLVNERIIVTGYVPSITSYLAQAAIVVAPLRLGGGMRVKILETLAAGKALITTPLAIEGLGLSNQEQVILAESDAEFIQAIVSLLRDAEMRINLAKRAHEWARNNLGWDKSISAYEELYTRLIGYQQSA